MHVHKPNHAKAKARKAFEKAAQDAPEKLPSEALEPLEPVQPEAEKGPPEPAQSLARVAAPNVVWKWSKRKRKAVRLVARGYPDTRIADELGAHRNTIRLWRRTAPFWLAVMAEAREYVNRTRFKRVYETGLLTDQLASQVAQRMAMLNRLPAGAALSQSDVSSLQLFLREYREFRSREATDFGDNVRRVEGQINLDFGAQAAVVDQQVIEQGTFHDFIERHVAKIPERLVTSATSVQAALVGVTRELLCETNVLEALESEDAGLLKEARRGAD
jgi:hypothetical protein